MIDAAEDKRRRAIVVPDDDAGEMHRNVQLFQFTAVNAAGLESNLRKNL